MSQAPPGRTENYGTAPFLPPPPSKPGRRPEPPQEPKGGYSVFGPGVTAFDSIIPPPTDTMDAPGSSSIHQHHCNIFPSCTHWRNALLHGLINGLNGLLYNSRNVSHGVREQPFQLTDTRSSSNEQPATRGQSTTSVNNFVRTSILTKAAKSFRLPNPLPPAARTLPHSSPTLTPLALASQSPLWTRRISSTIQRQR